MFKHIYFRDLLKCLFAPVLVIHLLTDYSSKHTHYPFHSNRLRLLVWVIRIIRKDVSWLLWKPILYQQHLIKWSLNKMGDIWQRIFQGFFHFDILIKFLLKCIPKDPICIMPALDQLVSWWPVDSPHKGPELGKVVSCQNFIMGLSIVRIQWKQTFAVDEGNSG